MTSRSEKEMVRLGRVGKACTAAVVLCAALWSGTARGAANDPATNVTAVGTGSQTVQVTWTEPTGGVNGYFVVPLIGGVQQATLQVAKSAGQNGHTFTNLTNGVSYTFIVKAIWPTQVVQSAASVAVIPAGSPSAPVINVVAGNARIDVSWTAPSANGSPIQNYTVSVGQGVADATVTGTSHSVTGVVNGTQYSVVVTANNAVGSTASSPQSVTPSAGIQPPTSVQATAGTGQVSLTWVAPLNTGGSPLDDYLIDVSPALAQPVTAAGTATTKVVTGLTAGTQYTFKIKSRNQLGDSSDWSSPSVTATPTAVPNQGNGGSSTGGGGGSLPPPTNEEGGTFPAARLGGADRFATAASISSNYFTQGVEVVYLATGASFADALTAGPAAISKGPVLLVSRDSISSATAAELVRLKPQRIVLLGGVSAISDVVLDAARPYTTGTVTRLGGLDRYETAAQISASRFSPGVAVAYLATGGGFADALAAGPSTLSRGPVLLVTSGSIPQATDTELRRLRPGRIVILGGVGVISAQVQTLAQAFTSGSVTRIGGADRYETAALLSAASFEPGVSRVFLATGEGYADALASGPVGSPILLTRPDCVPKTTSDEIARLRPTSIVVLGGQSALSTNVRNLRACAT